MGWKGNRQLKGDNQLQPLRNHNVFHSEAEYEIEDSYEKK